MPASASYTPPVSTLRIGLFFDSTALPSANLQNVSGFGSGFEFGYYDNNRQFQSIGAWTGEPAISMVMDRNMIWYPGDGTSPGEYREGTEGSVVLGCFHIQVDTPYNTFEEAQAASESYLNSYVKFDSGQFFVFVGQFTTREAASNLIDSAGLSNCSVNAGTSNTIVVVRTGTNQILFEYDYGGAQHLAVVPLPANNAKPETWFKNNRYTGGFQYARRGGALLTVVNYVDVEDYVKGILPYEMNNAWPIEALKAQACCARTYALSSLNRHSAHGADLCVEEHCQVYRGRFLANERTDTAVNETSGMYITYNGSLCQTFYASSNGGASENSENVWTEALPYLRGVIDPYEADVASRIPQYNWTITYTPEQITQRLRDRGTDCAKIVKMAVSQYTPTGNVLTVTMTDENGAQWRFSKRSQIISALGTPTQRFDVGNNAWSPGTILVNDPPQFVNIDSEYYAIDGSGNTVARRGGDVFAITGSGSIEEVTGNDAPDSAGGDGMVNGVFVIRGSGRGHNVGMSQWGAYSMAEYHGKNYVEIIKFYYTGVDVG